MKSARLSLRSVGYMLRQARVHAGLSLRELEAASGVSAAQILRVESSEYEPALTTFTSLCRALGLPCGLLIEDCSPPPWADYVHQAEHDERIRREAARLKLKSRSGVDVTTAMCALFASCRAVLEHLLLSSNPGRFAALIDDYPTPALENAVKEAARRIDLRLTATDRLSSLRALQLDYLSELRNFGICDDQTIRDFIASLEGEKVLKAWIPFNRELASAAGERPSDDKLPEASPGIEGDLSRQLIERFELLTSARGVRTAAAKALGLSPQKIGAWIMGKNVPEDEAMRRIQRWIEDEERRQKKR